MKHNWLKADSMWLLWTGQWSVQYAKFTLELVYAHQPYAQPNGSQAAEGIRVPNSFRQHSHSLIKLMHFSCHPLEDFLLFFVQCTAYSDILLVFIERKGIIFTSNSRLDASGCPLTTPFLLYSVFKADISWVTWHLIPARRWIADALAMYIC